MKIEIDVSGGDLFKDDYVICVSDTKGIIRGFKFTKELVQKLKSNWKKRKYNKCSYSSRPGKFKVRIYRIIIRYLLRKVFRENKEKNITVQFCRDFAGHEEGIIQAIRHQIEKVYRRKLKKIYCAPFPNSSDTHCYAKMMHNDMYNYLSCYSNISLKDIARGLIFHANKK